MIRMRTGKPGQGGCAVGLGLAMLLSTLLSGCAAPGALPRGAPERQPLPPWVAVLPADRDSAQAMLRLVAERRAALEVEWAQRESDCTQRFLVNPCLNALRLDRLAAGRQFGELELVARQVLRDEAARDRNQREAERLARDPAQLLP
jgi:colicin import membrane protein